MKRAFSLVEVLVVLVIVVILISLLLPVVNQTKGRAKEAVCIVNLRQLVAAMKLYESDNGGYPPNLTTYAGFASFYPTQLKCPARTGIGEDYVMNGSPLGNDTDLKRIKEAWTECRDARGEMFPIAADSNHSWRDKGSIFILGRENGSISAVQRESAGTGNCAAVDVLPRWINK